MDQGGIVFRGHAGCRWVSVETGIKRWEVSWGTALERSLRLSRITGSNPVSTIATHHGAAAPWCVAIVLTGLLPVILLNRKLRSSAVPQETSHRLMPVSTETHLQPA